MHRTDPIASPVLVDQSYWDAAYEGMQPALAPPADPVRQWIEAHVPPASGDRHALEIGCFPGRYLAVIGRLGYVVHGVDLTPAIDRMPAAMSAMGLRTGEFIHADFLAYAFPRRYDVVCSFGFIEHFSNWPDVLREHARLVTPGGLLVIETPNFRGWVQQLFHRWLDAVNLRRHHLPAMAPEEWADLVRAEGFDVQQQGYLGGFDFWTDTPQRGLLHRIGRGVLRVCSPFLRRLRPNAATSPYCVLIAKRHGPPAT